MKRWLLVWLLSALAVAAPNLRKDLEKAYAHSELCARLKFVDGMLGNRAAGFQLFGPDGLNRDLSLERDRFQLLFSRATRVRFRSEILKIVQTRDGAHVDVSQSLVVEQVDADSRERYTIVFKSRCIDSWRYTPGGLQLMVSSVQNQTSSRGGPLREKS